jgi:hypothetical protein
MKAVRHTTRLSLEQLESRDVPSASAATFQAAALILTSTESYSNIVAGEYQHYLGRAPDFVGFNFFLNQLQSGVPPEVIDAEFLSSTEFIANHGGVAGGWVPALYGQLLGRAPSTAEKAFWVDEAILGMTTYQIAWNVATSVERDVDVVRNEYTTLLGHGPDTAGLNFFVGAMHAGANRLAVAATIMGSTEYFADHGNTNTGFVDAAYAEVLGRTPSSTELSFWVTELTL